MLTIFFLGLEKKALIYIYNMPSKVIFFSFYKINLFNLSINNYETLNYSYFLIECYFLNIGCIKS